jgi:hypothetical protein
MKSEITLWEYHYVYMKTNTDDGGIEPMLNDMGASGWELVNEIAGCGGTPNDAKIHSYIFKRAFIG